MTRIRITVDTPSHPTITDLEVEVHAIDFTNGAMRPGFDDLLDDAAARVRAAWHHQQASKPKEPNP